MAIDELIAVVRPPSRPNEVAELIAWRDVERRLGIVLPPDYRDFAEAYGTGIFNDPGRLCVIIRNPFAATYEEVSLRLPGYVTPAVGLILLAFWPRGRKRLSDRAMNDDAEPTITAASEGKKGTRTFSVDTKTARRESR